MASEASYSIIILCIILSKLLIVHEENWKEINV